MPDLNATGDTASLSSVDTASATDVRTPPVAVWQVLEKLKGDTLKEWRLAEPVGRPMIEERNLDLPYPFGWYMACFSGELAEGEVKPLRYFDRDLVLWRGEDGVARMVDAYCRHLGANMGHGGRVRGNLLECPFHAWRYEADGSVAEIPYAKTIPPQVRKPCDPQWPVVERSRAVWFWYHPQGVGPLWEVEELAECTSPDWTPYEHHEWYVWGSLQNMAENGVDAAHFQFIHGTADFPDYKLTSEGHRRTGVVNAPMDTPWGKVDGQIAYGTVGPGQSWTRFSGIAETLLVAGVTPVAKDKVHVRFAFTQLRAEKDGERASVARGLIKNLCRQLDQDKVVWDRQRYITDPVICDGDGPIPAFRRYYAQFYAEWHDPEAGPAKVASLNMARKR